MKTVIIMIVILSIIITMGFLFPCLWILLSLNTIKKKAGRKKKYSSNAERQKAYRDRKNIELKNVSPKGKETHE